MKRLRHAIGVAVIAAAATAAVTAGALSWSSAFGQDNLADAWRSSCFAGKGLAGVGRSSSFAQKVASAGRAIQGWLRGEPNRSPTEPTAAPIPYDGRFVIARIRYTVGGWGGGFGRGSREPPWSHDHPRAERNFMKLLSRITSIRAYEGAEGGAVVDIGSRELFRYPIAYFCEPGYWTQTDQEAANLRAYLQKGGFLIVDDFRGRDLDNFTTEMRRVLPDARLIELDVPHQIFHSFFEIPTLEFHQFYDRGRPVFYGIFVDNDPRKRMLAIVNYNNDISEYWEWSDTGWEPIDLTNEAYKFGVNYVVYGMTH